jgi:hypothetical protein
MPRPFKTLSPIITTTALAFSFGLFAPLSAASAASNKSGLSSPGLQVEEVGYKHSKRRSLFVEDYYSPNYSVRSYRALPYSGSDEIRELQRFHPETLWPPSMRYFSYP